MHDHEVLELVAQARRAGGRTLEELDDLGPHVLEPLLGEEPPVEHGPASVGHARRLDVLAGLASLDGVDVDGRVPRGGRVDGHLGQALGQGRLQLRPHGLQQRPHVLDRAHPQERHAAVRDASLRGDLEPVDAAAIMP